MKRKYLFILTIALSALLLVCALSFTISAEEATTPTVSIDKFNLVFEDNVYLKYAVKFDGIDDADIAAENIGMLYFSTPCDDYTAGNESYSSGVVGHVTISGQKYYTFEYRHVTTREMTDYVYSVAYIDVDGVRYYSAPVKYSVLDYCYSKLGKTGVASDNEKYINLLIATLEQGAAAQEYFGYNTDRLANAEYYLVEVVGGTLEDGFTKGLYLSTDTVTITAPETSGELVFAEWQNSAGESVSTSNIAEITGFTKNDTYTAIYRENVKYSEGLIFKSYGNGTCYVKGIGTCTDSDLVIPPVSPSGETVTVIISNAFEDCSQITSVSIPNTVYAIGKFAFSWCNKMTSIEIPDSVTSIGYQAFSYCGSLKTIYIPKSAGLDSHALWNCYSLENIYVDENHGGLASIDGNLFSKDGKRLVQYAIGKKDTSYSIPNGVTSIANHAFCSSKLEEIIIPSSVISIEKYAFAYSKIKSIILPDGLSLIDEGVFCRSNLNSIVIGKNVSAIKDYAFSENNNLIQIYFKGTENEWLQITINAPGNYVLTEATIYYYSEETPSTEGNFWHYVDGVPTVWPAYVAPIYSEGLAFTSNGDGTCYVSGIGTCTDTEIVIPSTTPDGYSVTGIGDRAFYNCSSLTSVIIPDGITSIGNGAFYSCTSLKKIVIPDGVLTLNLDVFRGCSSLSDIEIPNSVKSIGNYAFLNCTSLNKLIIPDSVTSIGYQSFYGCLFTEIVIPDNVATIGNFAFHNCTSLTEIVIPNSVKNIGEGVFYGCTSLNKVVISDSVKSIGNSAFNMCFSLTEIVIPESVNIIGTSAFAYCRSLIEITIPSAVESIYESTFEYCTSLTKIVISDGVMGIGSRAFFGCSSLTNIVIPNSVTHISAYAFNYSSITNVYYAGSEEQWSSIYIGSNDVLTNAKIIYNYEKE